MHGMQNALRLLSVAALLLAAALAPAQGVYSDEEIDESVEAGLAYLAAIQRADGSYPDKYGETGAISALAGMAFLAKGYTPGGEKYGDTINRCIDFVISVYDPPSKYFGKRLEGSGMYVHSICTLFLSEISGMVDPERQAKFDEVLPLAVKLLLDAQNIRKNERDNGGWRYTPRSNDSDMSCSGWVLMALRSARLNGGKVPGDAIERAVAYVKRQYNEAEGSFHYQGTSGQYALTLTGAGILCLELCGRHNDPAAIKAARYLRSAFRRLPNEGNRCYGMYYTSQGLFQMGGEDWLQFEDWMYRTWIPRQRDDGSWTEEEDSPPYNTAMLVLAFSVPYRQLPIYQRDETVDEE